jgi:hypothetical protein
MGDWHGFFILIFSRNKRAFALLYLHLQFLGTVVMLPSSPQECIATWLSCSNNSDIYIMGENKKTCKKRIR